MAYSTAGMLLLALACTTPQPASVQAEALAAVHAGAWEDADEALGLCAKISAGHVRGECQLEAVRAAGAPCDRVDAGPWRDECWFMAGEAAGQVGDYADATRFCAWSGRFADDCCFHLWQGTMRDAVLRVRRDGSAAVEARGREVLGELAAVIDAPCLSPERFWMEWFQAAHDRDEPVDLSACDAHPEELRTWCRRGLEGVVMGRLDLLAPGSPDHVALCAAVREGAAPEDLPRVGCAGCGPDLSERITAACR